MPSITRSKNASGRVPIVVALHCSGAGGYEWRHLTRVLGQRFQLIAPDLIGCGAAAPWTGTSPFTASDEAVRVVDIIDAAEGPVHLVGHSYGGAIALRAALERPARIASLAVYEPMALHVLKTAGADGRAALEEITAFAASIDRAVLCGAYWAAAELFVDHFNGAGAFAAMEPVAQASVVRYIPKACLEFRALSEEPASLADYRRLNFPTLLLVGDHAAEPERLIGRQLAKAMTFASRRTVFGAGHMGPFTHQTIVNAMIADHIIRAEPHVNADAPFNTIPLAA